MADSQAASMLSAVTELRFASAQQTSARTASVFPCFSHAFRRFVNPGLARENKFLALRDRTRASWFPYNDVNNDKSRRHTAR
jgi:hypothetical protein